MHAAMTKPQYEVVSPAADARDASDAPDKHASASPLPDLTRKKLGLVWTAFSNGDIVLHAFREHLAQRHPELKFVEMAPGRNLKWGDHPDPSIAELARELGIDGAIVSAGC
jgi:hypothetical protein